MDKFALENCPNGGKNCRSLLKKINEWLAHAVTAHEDKNYQKVFKFEMLAFNETFTLTNKQCLGCGLMFRNVIIDSVKGHVEDLVKMTTGAFKNKSYLPALHQANQVLNFMEENLVQNSATGQEDFYKTE
jgi:hypothetical protein